MATHEILQNGIDEGVDYPITSSANSSALINSDSENRSRNVRTGEQERLAGQAMKLLEEGKFHAALQILNKCLNEPDDDAETPETDVQVEDLIKQNGLSRNDPSSSSAEGTEGIANESISDESNLIEKRCLVNMRLKRYTNVVQDAKRMLDFSCENPVAYKCLLAALCKMKKLEQANEVVRLWQKNAPRDLEMMECRTKLESLMVAVKNGIEASDAFSDVEELLGLNYDWLLLRKSKDPQWKHRPLPTSSRCSFVLCLQYRFGHCSLGEKCPDAHGEGELDEWKKRFEIENVTKRLNNLKVDDGSVYLKDLLNKIQVAGSTKKTILSDKDLEQLQVTCTSALYTTVQQRKFKKFTWKFTAKTIKPLTHVSLLHEHHRQYFHISSCSFVGPSDSVVLSQSAKSEPTSQVVTPHLSEAALAIAGGNTNSYKYKVKVVFTPEVYGNFRQSVIFDVGDEMKVVREISVDVVPPPDSDTDGRKSGSNERSSSPVEMSKGFRNNIPWNFGNADMIDANTGEKVQSDKLGFALMSSGSTAKSESFMENTKDPLSKAHYKERMRFLLTQEERARQEILAKYNVTTNVHLSEKYIVSGGHNEGMTRYAVDGALYGRINMFRDISEDTAVGRLILRSCNAVLLTKTEESRRKGVSSGSKIRVYFCVISDKSKNSVYLDLGKSCVSELDLKDGDVLQFDIQFQLDRTAFIEQKRVIDQLDEKHLDMLFPDLAINCNIPWSPIKQWTEIENSKYRLNPKQKEALIAITVENCKTPPILVIGPFGSGKTFTLAQCIRKILTQKDTRVMVCTHSNSAADLYIKEYLNSWVDEGFEEARPLRIYYEMRHLSSVHPVVLKYCTMEAMKFRPPTYDEIMKHRVIVVTLSTSYLLMEMNLPEDTFSHILLDEAAQAMESEAITPLMSAGSKTKLVLAGDHFQLSPELFSEEARNIHPSLLERLHALYPDTHPCKLMLCENYRSHSAIIQFVSDSFYTKKLECAKSQPVHDNFYPVTFFAARGEDVQESESTSYYNMAEVFALTEKVSELISSWPEKWGDFRDENAIGVLTPYADQVSRIRSRLRKKGLHSVSVERVVNVQGKQFRAVFLSTVRTFRPWVRILPEAVGNEVDLGFFSSPKLLNTALTRAQSLVAVVGDPVSLCSVGKCRRIWEDYIRICHERKSLFGITFLQLKQSILGVEMRLTWGLNPLANEFQPQKQVRRPPVTVTSHAAAIGPVSVSSSTYQFKGRQIQSQRQQYLAHPDPHGVYPMHPPYHHPQQYFDYNQINPPQATPFYPPQPAVIVRPPFQAIGLVPTPNNFPQYIGASISQWGPGVGPAVVHLPPHPHPPPAPPQSQNIPWRSAAVAMPQTPARVAIQQRPTYVQYAGVGQAYPPLNVASSSYVNPSQPPIHVNVTSEAYGHNHNNMVHAGVGQSEFATGQPLYRRPAAGISNNFDDRGNLNPAPLPTFDKRQDGLTPAELSFLTNAIDQHASSAEPFCDIQNLRAKIIQAASASSGDVTNTRPLPSINSTQAAATNYPVKSAHDHFRMGHTSASSGSTGQLGQLNVFTPIPQKSPVAPIERPVYNGYQESAATNALHNRIWSNSASTFPALNEGLHTANNYGSHGPGQSLVNDPAVPRNRLQNYDEQNARGIFNQPSNSMPVNPTQFQSLSNVPLNKMNSIMPQQQQGMPSQLAPPPSAYNNNTLPSYYEPGGYQTAEVGLKAQLSGGLRQGFGERSAFSRVNGNQDCDVVTDNSGLGRSYANVVKAAVTTAAVGALVSTSSMSMAPSSSNTIRPPQMNVPAPPVASSNLYNSPHSKYFGAIGCPAPGPGQFGPY